MKKFIASLLTLACITSTACGGSIDHHDDGPVGTAAPQALASSSSGFFDPNTGQCYTGGALTIGTPITTTPCVANATGRLPNNQGFSLHNVSPEGQGIANVFTRHQAILATNTAPIHCWAENGNPASHYVVTLQSCNFGTNNQTFEVAHNTVIDWAGRCLYPIGNGTFGFSTTACTSSSAAIVVGFGFATMWDTTDNIFGFPLYGASSASQGTSIESGFLGNEYDGIFQPLVDAQRILLFNSYLTLPGTQGGGVFSSLELCPSGYASCSTVWTTGVGQFTYAAYNNSITQKASFSRAIVSNPHIGFNGWEGSILFLGGAGLAPTQGQDGSTLPLGFQDVGGVNFRYAANL